MKINILLCDDDKDFLQRISDAVAGQPVPPGASICMAYIKKFNYDRVILLDGKELSVSQKRYSQMKVQYLSWKNKNWGNAR